MARAMTGRRGLSVAVLGAAAGAGLLLLAASRVWRIEIVTRPAPLRPEEIAHTGGSLAPLLPALGLVALAAAGGLLATRRGARRIVGGLLVVVALGATVLVLGAMRGANPVWPVLCLVGAILVAAAGTLAIRDGGRWPVMGSRYARGGPAIPSVRPEPPTDRQPPMDRQGVSGGQQGAVGDRPNAPGDKSAADLGTRERTPRPELAPAELWDALERGEDPTARA